VEEDDVEVRHREGKVKDQTDEPPGGLRPNTTALSPHSCPSVIYFQSCSSSPSFMPSSSNNVCRLLYLRFASASIHNKAHLQTWSRLSILHSLIFFELGLARVYSSGQNTYQRCKGEKWTRNTHSNDSHSISTSSSFSFRGQTAQC